MNAFMNFRTLKIDFDGAVDKLLERHKEDYQWVLRETIEKELSGAIEQIIDDLLEEPTDFFTRTFATIHTHYDPTEKKISFDTKEEAEQACVELEQYFGEKHVVVPSDFHLGRWLCIGESANE